MQILKFGMVKCENEPFPYSNVTKVLQKKIIKNFKK